MNGDPSFWITLACHFEIPSFLLYNIWKMCCQVVMVYFLLVLLNKRVKVISFPVYILHVHTVFHIKKHIEENAI